jgi:putative endonuclease
MTNRPNGTLYTGVTSNISRRAWEHREGLIDGFTKQYGLKRLVYMERYDDIRDAIQRERTIKHYPRAWKVRLILVSNPEWNDLYDTLARLKGNAEARHGRTWSGHPRQTIKPRAFAFVDARPKAGHDG